MKIPVLWQHNASQPIGSLSIEYGKLVVEFDPDIDVTLDMFFDIFGGCGFTLLVGEKKNGLVIVRRAALYEFSYVPRPDGLKRADVGVMDGRL